MEQEAAEADRARQAALEKLKAMEADKRAAANNVERVPPRGRRPRIRLGVDVFTVGRANLEFAGQDRLVQAIGLGRRRHPQVPSDDLAAAQILSEGRVALA